MGWPLEVSATSMRAAFDVNTVGPLVLFQATYPLLKASTPTPKFVGISASTASMGLPAPWRAQYLPHAVSKVGLNFMLRTLRFHYEDLICIPISPGLVATDLVEWMVANDKADHLKELQPQAQTIEENAISLLKIIDSATRETDAFMDIDGSEIPW